MKINTKTDPSQYARTTGKVGRDLISGIAASGNWRRACADGESFDILEPMFNTFLVAADVSMIQLKPYSPKTTRRSS